MIQLPQINLGSIAPVLALAAIAFVCILALIAVTLLRSRLVLIIAVVLCAPLLAGALAGIVAALVPLAIVVVAGLAVILVVLSRSPELLSLVRDLVPRKAPPAQLPPLDPPLALPGSSASTAIVNQPRRPAVRTRVNADDDRWGF